MFDNYFTYWDDLPEDSGFALFGLTHIIWLLLIAGGIIWGTMIYRRKSQKSRKKILHGLAYVMAGMELYKDAVLAITGNMQAQYLPLQLCGLAVIIEILYAFVPCVFLGEVMCIACMPGALAALLFPDWTKYPVINFMNLHSFIIHGILVLVPVMLMAAGEFQPKLRRIYMVLGFFVVVVPIMMWVNLRLDTNFMFLELPSRGSPFERVYQTLGYSGYLLVYGIVVVILILVVYGILSLILGKYKKRRT